MSIDGKVNYAEWKDRVLLPCSTTIQNFRRKSPADYWSKNDSLAYFINAYNAVTVKLILDHYPTKSIRKLITPWRFKRFKLAGKKFHLTISSTKF